MDIYCNNPQNNSDRKYDMYHNEGFYYLSGSILQEYCDREVCYDTTFMVNKLKESRSIDGDILVVFDEDCREIFIERAIDDLCFHEASPMDDSMTLVEAISWYDKFVADSRKGKAESKKELQERIKLLEKCVEKMKKAKNTGQGKMTYALNTIFPFSDIIRYTKRYKIYTNMPKFIPELANTSIQTYMSGKSSGEIAKDVVGTAAAIGSAVAVKKATGALKAVGAVGAVAATGIKGYQIKTSIDNYNKVLDKRIAQTEEAITYLKEQERMINESFVRRVPVNEAYFGKTKDILAIEKQIGVIRKKYNGTSMVYYSGEYNTDKEVLKLNRLFEKAFGFYCFSLTFVKDDRVNAMTVPVAYKYDTRDNLFDKDKLEKISFVDKDGMHFSKNNNLCITSFVYTGLFFNPSFTDGEITAVLLHEIGHNFAECIDPQIATNSCILTNIMLGMDIVELVMSMLSQDYLAKTMSKGRVPGLSLITRNNSFDKTMEDFRHNMVYAGKPATTIFATFETCNAIMNRILGIVNTVTMLLQITRLPEYLLAKFVASIIKPFGYRNEKIADRFATMYGYGPELTSALMKMETKDTVIERMCPFLANMAKLVPFFLHIVLGVFDPHPKTSERLMDQIRALEHEVKNSNVDPKLKKELQRQIDEIYKQRDKLIHDVDNNNVFNDPSYFRKVWLRIFSNGDLRHYICKDLNDVMDQGMQKYDIKEASNLIGYKRNFNVVNW